MTTQEIFDKALRLSVNERFQLLDALQLSITPTLTEIDDAWLTTAKQRLADFDKGKVQAIPSERVFADIRDALNEKHLSS